MLRMCLAEILLRRPLMHAMLIDFNNAARVGQSNLLRDRTVSAKVSVCFSSYAEYSFKGTPMFVASDMGGNPPFKLSRWNSLYIRQLSMFMDALPPIPGDEQNSTMWDAVVEKVKHLYTNHSELLDQFLDPEQYLDPSWQPHYDVESMVWVMWWFFLRAKTKTSTQVSPKEKGTHAKMCIAMTTHEIKEGSIDERLVLILECHNTQTMKDIINDEHAPFAQML